jgi:hypothetical protein
MLRRQRFYGAGRFYFKSQFTDKTLGILARISHQEVGKFLLLVFFGKAITTLAIPQEMRLCVQIGTLLPDF